MFAKRIDALKEMVSALKGAQVIETKKELAKKMNISQSALSRATCGEEKYLTDRFMRRCAIFCKGLLPEDALIFDYLPPDYSERQEKPSTPSNLISSNSNEIDMYIAKIKQLEETLEAERLISKTLTETIRYQQQMLQMLKEEIDKVRMEARMK